jgi:predicted transcriptional regulator
MRVAELMQSDLSTIHVDDRVSDAIARFAEAHVSGLPVLDDRGAFVGVLSTTDILVAESESDSPRTASATVRELMTPRPLTIGADEDVRAAARQMLYAEVHRLFVEHDHRPVGVISQTDIVRAVANGQL